MSTTGTQLSVLDGNATTLQRAASHNASPKSASDESTGPLTLASFKDQQSNILPHKKLMVVFPTIALAQMISYLDQTSTSTALPAIGSDLNLGPSISWVATSFLLASTAIQLINGRLSDIVGRKPLLLTCMGILALGDLGSGFARSGPELFACRTISGIGGGAITALVMIVASDITTLEQRGKYNGFIGAMVGLGNGLGPLFGGVVTQRASWRWVFWVLAPCVTTVMLLLYIVIPPSNVQGKPWVKFKMIDWLGLSINVAAVVFLLIPISAGGSIYAWDSAIVISMLIIGILLAISFVIVEWKVAKLPIMPLRLFQSDMSANLVLIQGTLHGVVYWANLFYIPIYLQNVRGYNPILSGVIILPLVASHGVGSLLSGQIISRTGHYNPTIISANFVWLIGASLQTIYTRTTPVWAICVIGFLQGIGIGCAFQPGLVALLAHSRKADRAVVNSLRNFLRTMGGSIGLTISGTILNNILKSKLSSSLSNSDIQTITSSVYALKTLDLTAAERNNVIDAYMSGIHTVFLMYAPIMGVCCICALLIKDNGVAEKDAKVAGIKKDEEEKSEASGTATPITTEK